MFCPSCHAENDDEAEACFTCGRALYALTQGILLNQRYEVLSPLGSGGMGRVYKAHDRVLDEHVAIKVLRSELTREPEMARRFRSEIKLARRVSHRNVCRIHEYGEDGGLAFICMEYIDGKNVREYLAERALSPQEALELSLQVVEGLQAVHEHGIVHRDFKASNIMIDQRGVVKLMDFGIAKQAAADTTSLTTSGVIGTPEYMSPEQASGARVDLRSDLYSLGCVVYEAFTGAPPFRGATPLETMRLQEHEPPPLDSAAIPDPVREVLRHALAKDPAQRYASAAEFAGGLREARARLGLDGSPARLSLASAPAVRPRRVAPTHTVGEARPTHRARLRRVAAPALGGALAVLAVVFWVEWRAARDAGPAVRGGPSQASGGAGPLPGESQPVAPPGSVAPPALESADPTSAPQAPPATTSGRPPTRQAASTAPLASSAPPTPRPARAAPTPLPTPEAAQGTLSLLIVPESEVEIDGVSIGAVSRRELRLSAGAHWVRVLHPEYKPLQRKVRILPDVATSLVLDLSEKGIRRQP